MTFIPADQPARDRIERDLTTNLLVEAGAGSGKTTSLVRRLLEHVRTGTPVDQLTAVTFTRKAANELRERFQVELEARVMASDGTGDDDGRYREALRSLDRMYIGTIHGFCARLLRERPLEVAIDPDFTEVSGEDWVELEQSFWRSFIERARRQDDPGLTALHAVGLDPRQLGEAFSRIVAYPDVDFPLEEVAPPDASSCRRQLELLVEDAFASMPAEEPDGGWDPLQRLVRRLRYVKNVEGWHDLVTLCAVLEQITPSSIKVTQKQWGSSREARQAARDLSQSFESLLEQEIAPVLRQWREFRYPKVMSFLRDAASAFERQRRSAGLLGFEDLLLLTAKLLRESPAARDELGARYAFLLVDEFQDTDPVQAEVCFLLASPSSEGTAWQRVTPRAGALFVVGDPKQSIYRFRRADIQVYDLVKRRMAEFGGVLALTANFRSNDRVRDLVNGYFEGSFPAESTPQQAAYSPMETVKSAASGEGVARYETRYTWPERGGLVERDAALVASWIEERIARGERKAGDFLILTPTRKPIESYARALAERNIPASTTGAELPQEHELRELLVVLRAIADPENAIRVAAALEGLFFGLSPADLWRASQAKLRFAITHPPSDPAHKVGVALAQLHEWWKLSQRHAADVLLDRILDETGLLVHAASQPLGDARAGALMHLVESLRLASIAGANGIADAMDRLELLLSEEAPDTPLRPGREDAVRVMNLHKAKGLEATVVVLAAPLKEPDHEPLVHITRSADGTSLGWCCLTSGKDDGKKILAQPLGWSERAAAEATFAQAERERLRYVAATRAKAELVVAQATCVLKDGEKPDASMWRPFEHALHDASVLQLSESTPPGREPVSEGVEALLADEDEARQRMAEAARPSIVVETVTERSKLRTPTREDEVSRASAAERGAAWGRAMHRALEALARGRREGALRLFARAAAADEGLSTEDQEGVVTAIAAVEASGEVDRLRAAGTLRAELSVMRIVDGQALEGVIDAAVESADGWRAVDWKTDSTDDAGWERRREQYERQVGGYAELLAELSGKGASGTLRRIPRGRVSG